MNVVPVFVFIAFICIIVLMMAIKAKRSERERILVVNSKYTDINTRIRILEKKIWQGMSRENLIDAWGQPSSITQQVLKTKIKETLRYGSYRASSSVYLEGGRVVGWRQPK